MRREPAAKFLLAWLVPSWIVFELVVTELPHYVLPLYPAIAILIAGAVESKVLSQRPWLVRGAVWWFIAPILISAAVVTLAIVVAVIQPFQRGRFSPWRWSADCLPGCLPAGWCRAFRAPGNDWYSADGNRRVFNNAAVAAAGIFQRDAVAILCHRIARIPSRRAPAMKSQSVFLAGTDILLTDASSAADFSCEALADLPSSKRAAGEDVCASRRGDWTSL